MFECAVLTRKNINALKSMNTLRKEFNEINKDFFEIYNKSNFAQQIFLRRNVLLLKKDMNYCGYIWFTKEDKYNYCIESMYIVSNIENFIHGYNTLINGVSMFTTLQYLCLSNENNKNVLEDLGFNISQGTIELVYDMEDKDIYFALPDTVRFEKFIEGKDEAIRCTIQNTVFNSNNRIPLTIEDIYCDESQKYYIDQGAVLVKVNDEYAGYGQIILEDMTPVIVNVGIINKYRGKGYGRFLILQLLKIIKSLQYSRVKIRVSSDNYIAQKLYKSIGFREVSYKYLWELKKFKDLV